MKRYQSPPKKKYLDTENSAIARFQRERPTPKRRKPSSERPMGGKRRIKTTPLPEGLEPKQGVMANQQSKNNKMLWIAGGIVGVLILGYFIFKKKK